METKLCKKCELNLPLADFTKCSASKDGLYHYCRVCKRSMVNKLNVKNWQTKNQSKLNLASSNWKIRNPQKAKEIQDRCNKNFYINNKTKCTEASKKYRVTNRERVNTCCREWRKNNKDKVKEYNLAYQRNNPEGFRTSRLNIKARRRARLLNNYVEDVSLKDLYNNYDKMCFYCQKPLLFNEVTLDHYIPISKGGAHSMANSRPACIDCNRRKSNILPEEFLNRIGRTDPKLIKAMRMS